VARLARYGSRRIGLSATPYSIGVIDLWAQLDMLEPECWGKWVDFAFRYCDARTGTYGGLNTSGESNIDELRDRVNTLMHTVSRKTLEESLPGKSRELVVLSKADLNAPVKNALQLIKEAKATGDEETFWEAQLAVAASMKRDWVVNLAKDALRSDQKMVILTNRREEVEAIFDRLNIREFKGNVLASHGGSSLDERESQRLQYKGSPGPLVLIGTHESWGTAIDGLQSTDVAVMLSLPYTPRTLGQSETRFIRKGQTRRVRIIYPIAEGTVDDRVNERLLTRLDTLKDLLDGEEESDQARAILSGFGEGDEGLDSVLSGLLSDLS
jgi:SNF2 family DNA or RNA helicase